MRNNERIIRHTKHALSWLKFDWTRSPDSSQPRSTVKRAQRRLQQIKDAVLRERYARKQARKSRQHYAASKWQRSHSSLHGTSRDMSMTPDGADTMDNGAIQCRLEFCP